VAEGRGEHDLAMAIRQRMALYEAGQPLRIEGRWSIN
jgi:hypothetical protein